MIIKGLSWGQNLRVTDRAYTLIREQGGVIEEVITEEGTDEGGSINGDMEKEEKVVVGSLDSVGRLARKEGLTMVQEDVRTSEV